LCLWRTARRGNAMPCVGRGANSGNVPIGADARSDNFWQLHVGRPPKSIPSATRRPASHLYCDHRPMALRPGLTTGLPLSRTKRLQALLSRELVGRN
jgi:hypothetical protein